jgi:hypothetical protein
MGSVTKIPMTEFGPSTGTDLLRAQMGAFGGPITAILGVTRISPMQPIQTEARIMMSKLPLSILPMLTVLLITMLTVLMITMLTVLMILMLVSLSDHRCACARKQRTDTAERQNSKRLYLH